MLNRFLVIFEAHAISLKGSAVQMQGVEFFLQYQPVLTLEDHLELFLEENW